MDWEMNPCRCRECGTAIENWEWEEQHQMCGECFDLWEDWTDGEDEED